MAFNAALRIAAELLVVTAMMPFAFVGAGQAQDYPTRPIRIIVPTQPGGMSDILSRLYAQKLTERTGATVVVENKTGANGVLAADYVAKSAPDGYTIFLGFQGTQSVMQHLDPKLPYDPVKDFAPVVLLASNPSILAVHPSFPARTVKEFVEVVKAKPGTYSYASAGFGTTHHLAAELFKLAANVDIAGVTYRGAAPANQDVIAGHVPIVFDSIGNAMTNVRAGTVRAPGGDGDGAVTDAAGRADHGRGRLPRRRSPRPGSHSSFPPRRRRRSWTGSISMRMKSSPHPTSASASPTRASHCRWARPPGSAPMSTRKPGAGAILSARRTFSFRRPIAVVAAASNRSEHAK